MPDPSTISILDQVFEPDVVSFGGSGLTTGDDTEPYFFGVISDIRFTIVTFAARGEGFGFDNVSFSSVAPVPLPAPLSLLAFSLAGLFALRRFKAA